MIDHLPPATLIAVWQSRSLKCVGNDTAFENTVDGDPTTPSATLLWQLLLHHHHFYDGGNDLEAAALQSSSGPGRDMWLDEYISHTVPRNEKPSIINHAVQLTEGEATAHVNSQVCLH